MPPIHILWADDEIDLLKPHITFLSDKGYNITTATNGIDAVELCKKNNFDLIFLDEHMPGPSGIETLSRIKSIESTIPVIMITKSEEEQIMDDAIGAKISDYLIKPVNPNQILLAIKKAIDNKRLRSEKTTTGYQQDFRNIGISISENMGFEKWKEVYRKLIYWELELQELSEHEMNEVFVMQKAEANSNFYRYIEKNYLNWLRNPDKESPVLSHQVFKKFVLPNLNNTNDPLFFILIDNLRYDQWKVIQHVLNEYFRINSDELYLSILPTTTQYARNALFSGMLPSEIQKKYQSLWKDDADDEGKNLHEETFLKDQLQRNGISLKHSYNKITNLEKGKALIDKISNLMHNQLNVIIYNFVDMLSHARTDMEIIKELAGNEAAYRSITLSWLEHSPLLEVLKKLSRYKCKLIITTDHGSIRVGSPSKVIGDKNTTSNLRYKQGKQLQYNPKDVLVFTKPEEAFLPKTHINSSFIFAKEDNYFIYPNNYNYYMNFFNDTFQHGGVSMEEMMIPFICLNPK